MHSPDTIHDVLKLIVISLINCQVYDEIHIGMAICYMPYTSAYLNLRDYDNDLYKRVKAMPV